MGCVSVKEDWPKHFKYLHLPFRLIVLMGYAIGFSGCDDTSWIQWEILYASCFNYIFYLLKLGAHLIPCYSYGFLTCLYPMVPLSEHLWPWWFFHTGSLLMRVITMCVSRIITVPHSMNLSCPSCMSHNYKIQATYILHNMEFPFSLLWLPVSSTLPAFLSQFWNNIPIFIHLS